MRAMVTVVVDLAMGVLLVGVVREGATQLAGMGVPLAWTLAGCLALAVAYGVSLRVVNWAIWRGHV